MLHDAPDVILNLDVWTLLQAFHMLRCQVVHHIQAGVVVDGVVLEAHLIFFVIAIEVLALCYTMEPVLDEAFLFLSNLHF